MEHPQNTSGCILYQDPPILKIELNPFTRFSVMLTDKLINTQIDKPTDMKT